jgi:hypothetical protein
MEAFLSRPIREVEMRLCCRSVVAWERPIRVDGSVVVATDPSLRRGDGRVEWLGKGRSEVRRWRRGCAAGSSGDGDAAVLPVPPGMDTRLWAGSLLGSVGTAATGGSGMPSATADGSVFVATDPGE